MKYLYIALLSFLIAPVAKAQKIRFTDETNTWHLTHNATQVNIPITVYYDGDSAVNGVAYKKMANGITLPMLVREDTVAQKVYMLPHYDVGQDTSTTERLLYDYTLQIDDTITQVHQSVTYKHYVESIDSVMMNAVWHKLWKITATGGNGDSYDVIEGIGAVNSPWYPADPDMGLSFFVLHCFSNNNTEPEVSPAVGMFDNNISCTLGIANLALNKKANVAPNPINSDSKIFLPVDIKAGKLVIYSNVGKTVLATEISNTSAISIGSKISIPGIYYFKVTELSGNHIYSGKFLK